MPDVTGQGAGDSSAGFEAGPVAAPTGLRGRGNPLCPRCGYDQSGAVATWAEACPLRGTCPECGYEFAWREIFNPDEKRLPRFVEHCPRRAIPVAAMRTLLWALIPGRFWKRVKLHHEVRRRRWVVWLVLVLLGWHGVNVGLATVVNWTTERAYDRSHYAKVAAARNANGRPPLAPYVAPRLSWRHFAVAAGHPIVEHEYSVRWGRVTPFSWRQFSWRFSAVETIVPSLGIGATLSMPLVAMVMPATRRKYRVRRSHILRATIFGLSWLAVPLAIRTSNELSSLAFALNDRSPVPLVPGFLETAESGLTLVLLIFAWLWWWWFRAMGASWGIPRAAGHALSLVTIAMLLPLAVLAMIDMPFVGDLISRWSQELLPTLPKFVESDPSR